MSIYEGSKTELFVCNVTNGNAAAFASLPNGSGGFYHYPNGALNEDAIAAGEILYFVCRTSEGVLHFSPPFGLTNMKHVYSSNEETRIEQISYAGYNGTSGSLDADNSTYYSIRVVLDHTFGMLNNSPLMLTIPYKSSAAATQSEIAANLAIIGTTIFDRQSHKPMKIERVNSGAEAVDLNNFALTHGSKYFTSADDDTLTLTVGTIVRIEEPESDGPATTDPCYIIAAHDSGAGAARIYELDQPFQGVTNADHDHVGTVTEGNWGLKFTGISVTDANFNPITDEPTVTSFTLELGENFSTAAVTNSTVPYVGTGTYQLCSAFEAYCQFQNKTREISAYPPTKRAGEVTAAIAPYHVHSFEIWNDEYESATTGIKPTSPMRIVIFEDAGLTEDFITNLGTTLLEPIP